MEIALYHPAFGYYRNRNPFGRQGDFYTAEQIQPVFGRLIAEYLRQLATDAELSEPVTLVELGAGRREMAEAFARFQYIGVDTEYGVMPERFTGIVFSNEFFDALPVDVLRGSEDGAVNLLVTCAADRFAWVEGSAVVSDIPLAPGELRELQHRRVEWLHTINARLEEGIIVTIDYGYLAREIPRFPRGTLMAYRKHQAREDVLNEPGEQDITAHVDFTALQSAGVNLGWETVRYESLAQALLRAGEADQFQSAMEGCDEAERVRHRLQVKTLLYGMGETFRVLVQRKTRHK
jgi:SAM-dependent MidA family methyltransferase